MKLKTLVRHQRKALGLTQTALGEILGLSDVAITLIESGKNTPPTKREQELFYVLGLDSSGKPQYEQLLAAGRFTLLDVKDRLSLQFFYLVWKSKQSKWPSIVIFRLVYDPDWSPFHAEIMVLYFLNHEPIFITALGQDWVSVMLTELEKRAATTKDPRAAVTVGLRNGLWTGSKDWLNEVGIDKIRSYFHPVKLKPKLNGSVRAKKNKTII